MKNRVVYQRSLRSGSVFASDQLMTLAEAEAWAAELRARPANRYMQFWVGLP